MELACLFPADRESSLAANRAARPIPVTDPNTFEPSELEGFAGVVVEASEPLFAQRIAQRFRQDTAIPTYLKPLFVFSPDERVVPYVRGIFDAVLENWSLAQILEQTASIQARIAKLQEATEASFQIQIMTKILRFLYTRQVQLVPILDPRSPSGYVFPFVDACFSDEHDVRALDVIRMLDQEGLIEGRFVDRLHLCNSCHSAFINFREACPGCRSSYLRVSDTIHHFACGCVAPEENYVSESALVCPKCERLLRHIGLDYDKPSTIYTCLVCSERFQDADVEGFCFDCQHVSPAEDLVQRDIKEYGLTPEGESYSIYGMEFSVSTLFQDKLDFVDFTAFKTLLSYEIERIKRYRNQSCLAYLRISNLPQLYLRFGERKEEIALEIARIVQESIRRSDVSAPMNDSTFVFLLVETPEQNCSQVTDRIESRLKKLVEQNFSAADEEMLLDFELNGIALTGEFRVEELSEQLLVED